MKKLFLFILLIISVSGFSQIHKIGLQGANNSTNLTADNSKQDIAFYYGLHGDTNSNSIGGYFEDNKYKTWIICGFNYEFLIKGKISLGADILYSQNGYKGKVFYTNVKGEGMGSNSESRFYYNYLSIPVKLGYISNHVFAKIGFCPSYLLNFKTTQPSIDQNGNISYDKVEVNDDLTKFDLSALIELGASTSLNEKMDIFSSINYKYSITSFSKTDYYSNDNLRHYGFSLCIGVRYKFEKE